MNNNQGKDEIKMDSVNFYWYLKFELHLKKILN